MKYLRKPKNMALWKVIVLDLLLIGVILVTFAFFHHVLPSMIAQYQMEQVTPVVTEPATQPSVTQTQAPEQTQETTEPDLRTPWQKKFADKFTDEVVITENSYTSPEVSITLETVVVGEGNSRNTYYVADIYVASLENFFTYTAHGQMKYFDTQDAEEMAAESNAIVAISGDFLTYQKGGFLLRNGEIYASNRNYSICALFPDGTMQTYDGGTYKIDDILAKDPVQVWSFGPVLLDEEGQVRSSYNVSQAVSFPNPRSGIGYFEPGHYCFVVVDGRQNGYSKGMLISEFAQVFADMGCVSAYNLDGGGTAVMLYDGKKISKQSNGNRALGDILLITESGYTVGMLEDEE